MNNIREGLIPAILGSAVTAVGIALKQKSSSNDMIAFRFSAHRIRCN